MFSAAEMVTVKSIIEKTYDDSCVIYSTVKEPGEDHITRTKKKAGDPIPCRLSFGGVTPSDQQVGPNDVAQSIKLFVSPDVSIPPGATIDVTREGTTTTYKQSGKPSRYVTHQEIALTLEEVFA